MNHADPQEGEGEGTHPAENNQKPKGQVLGGQIPTVLTARGKTGRQTLARPEVPPDSAVMSTQSHLGPIQHPGLPGTRQSAPRLLLLQTPAQACWH